MRFVCLVPSFSYDGFHFVAYVYLQLTDSVAKLAGVPCMHIYCMYAKSMLYFQAVKCKELDIWNIRSTTQQQLHTYFILEQWLGFN